MRGWCRRNYRGTLAQVDRSFRECDLQIRPLHRRRDLPCCTLGAWHGALVENRRLACVDKGSNALRLDPVGARDLVRRPERGSCRECAHQVADIVERASLVDAAHDRHRAGKCTTGFARSKVGVCRPHQVHLERQVVELQSHGCRPGGNVAAGSCHRVETRRFEGSAAGLRMLQLVLERSKVFLELGDAVPNHLTRLAQLVLVLDVFWTQLTDADHLGEFGIAASPNEARHLFALGLGFELEALQLCELALVSSSLVLDLLRKGSERLCQREHLWQIAERPFGGIGKVFDGLWSTCRLAQVGKEGSALVDVRAKHLKLLCENKVCFEEFALNAALADFGRAVLVGRGELRSGSGDQRASRALASRYRCSILRCGCLRRCCWRRRLGRACTESAEARCRGGSRSLGSVGRLAHAALSESREASGAERRASSRFGAERGRAESWLACILCKGERLVRVRGRGLRLLRRALRSLIGAVDRGSGERRAASRCTRVEAEEGATSGRS